MYFHPYLDTETNAAKRYPDSLAVDENGVQQVYRRCAAGTDRPLFIPTTTNSYGKMLAGYVPLAMDTYSLGGIYHDEFGEQLTDLCSCLLFSLFPINYSKHRVLSAASSLFGWMHLRSYAAFAAGGSSWAYT